MRIHKCGCFHKNSFNQRAKKWWKPEVPAVVGLLCLFLLTMGLATYRVKEKFSDEFETAYETHFSMMFQSLAMKTASPQNVLWNFAGGETKYQQYSGAVYGPDGEIICESGTQIAAYTLASGYPAEEYLDESQIRELAQYASETAEMMAGKPEKYRISIKKQRGGDLLGGIVVQKIEWQEGQGPGELDPISGSYHSWEDHNTLYYQAYSATVWEWQNPDLPERIGMEYLDLNTARSFPRLLFGYQDWEQYCDNAFLHTFPRTVDLSGNTREEKALMDRLAAKKGRDRYMRSTKVTSVTGTDSDALYFILLSESRPWAAAADFMRTAYIAGLQFLAICIAVTAVLIRGVSRKRESIEESRRNFTNAMAHELKTPLGVIRGFAENLKEDTVSGKRDYYIEQIIGQTEEMDSLVAQMIYLSKLDSDQPAEQREEIIWMELVQTQLKKFDSVISEKEIRVQIAGDGSFRVKGERGLLEKAVWNVLSNAVFWCSVEGEITVHMDARGCSVKNTGPQIAPEHLPHVFEMLYRADEGRSRESGERHLGMGLYLTKRILDLHHLNVTIENVSDGVLVRIEK